MALVGRRFVMACKFTHFFSFGQKTSLCRFRFFYANAVGRSFFRQIERYRQNVYCSDFTSVSFSRYEFWHRFNNPYGLLVKSRMTASHNSYISKFSVWFYYEFNNHSSFRNVYYSFRRICYIFLKICHYCPLKVDGVKN